MERIGPYRVLRRLGGGAMGEVLEAVDDGLRRTVALKVIAPHLAADPAFRARFGREAQALARLDSPHVVRVHAYGEHGGRLWMATQLVPDGDLGAWLQRHGPLPPREALDLVAQVAAGLADAHAAGLVHRDVKPGNVLLDRSGPAPVALLGDFGVAGSLSPEQTRTRAGTLGTPAYMAPELHTGGVAGVASDVYALGCLLWVTLTGRSPYGGDSDYEVARAHVEQPPPQLRGTSPLERGVDALLRRLLAKEPGVRPATAEAVRVELERLRGLSLEPARRRVRWPAVVVAAGLVVAAAAAAFTVTRHDDASDPATPAGSTSSATGARTPVPTTGRSGEDAGDRRAAVASLGEALADQGLMSGEQAACMAEEWVALAGLAQMAQAGFFDDRWRYVDQQQSEMTPAIRDAATRAALRCTR